MTTTYVSICAWLNPDTLSGKELSKYSVDELDKVLAALIERSILATDEFTYSQAEGVWQLVTELMNRGIGPRWLNDHTRQLPPSDLELFDLYWVSRHFPRHQTLQDAWNKCFDPEVGEKRRLREMRRIAGLVSYSRRQKLRILKLKRRQIVCCRYYGDIKVQDIREKIRKSRDLAARRIRASSETKKAEQSIGTKLRWWECARLVGKTKPTDMALVYTAMTGKKVSRQAAQKAVISIQKCGLLTGKASS